MPDIPITILTAANGTPLCKSATMSYPNVFKFTSEETTINNTREFCALIKQAAKQQKCLLKGQLKAPLNKQSRAGSTDRDEPTQWICLDLDGVDLPDVSTFIHTLPEAFHTVSYIQQESASLGTKPGLRYHLFMLLKQTASPTILKAILKHINATIPILLDQITLGRGDSNILKYPLDITTCQNDKLLYIAPRSDKPATKKHIQHIKKTDDLLDIDKIHYRPAADKKTLLTCKNKLRKEAGLPTRRETTKVVDGKELFTAVDEALIDEIKTDNGFVRFNLKGSISKSFRYYHPKNNYEYIHSFGDDETLYMTRSFFPAYYRSCTGKSIEHEGKEYFAVRDVNTDRYYTVITSGNEIDDIRVTGSARKATDFCLEHGNKCDYIPTWNVICAFTSDTQINKETKYINTYRKSNYLMQATDTQKKPPAFIHKVVKHMLGDDADAVERFYNWLAVITQKGMRTQTAWLLHGTTGTGKGLICDYVIRPLIGGQYTSKVRLSDFSERFNDFMSDKLILFVNEAQMSSMDRQKAGSAINNIKDCITDETIRVEGKNRKTVDQKNNCNLLFSSNQHDPIEIEANDRRINVPPRQEEQLVSITSESDRQTIVTGKELQQFANYLMFRAADTQIAHTTIDTRAKSQVQEATMDTHRALIYQLSHGDFSKMVRELNTFEIIDLNELSKFGVITLGNKAITYHKIITRMVDSSTTKKRINLSRAELLVLFYCLLGYIPASVYKFSAHLNRNGTPLKNIRINGKQTQGIGPIQFSASKETLQIYNDYTQHKDTNIVSITGNS